MYSHSLRSRIVTGSFTLPIMVAIALLVWLLPHSNGTYLWVGLILTLFVTYALMELNNRHSLLRIRSRMVSSTYLAITAACPMLHSWNESILLELFLVFSYFMLFASYQNIHSQGYIFHAFLFAGVGAILYPPMLVIVLPFYFSMLFQLRCFTGRTFAAGFLGFILPFWILAAYAIWQNRLLSVFSEFIEWFSFTIPDYSTITNTEWVTVGVLLAFVILAMVHFFSTSYNDKIRIRIFFYVIITQEFFLIAGMALLPQFFTTQLSLFVVNSAPILARYFALAKGRFPNSIFYIFLIMLLGIGILNYLFSF